jgi:ribonuclease Z
MLVHLPHIFVTHMHIDHAAGVSFYAGQRRLQALHSGTVYVPAEVREEVLAMLSIQARLTGAEFDVDLVGMKAGDEVRVGRTHVVRAHDAPHRVAARAYEVIELRHRLREDLEGRTGDEIADLRRRGVAVETQYRHPILFYTGDTDRSIFADCDAMFGAEVLIIECSFVADGHQDRALKYRHIHIDDIADQVERFRNDLIVLTHFSRRYSREEIRDTVRRRLPAGSHARFRLALPEPFQRL